MEYLDIYLNAHVYQEVVNTEGAFFVDDNQKVMLDTSAGI